MVFHFVERTLEKATGQSFADRTPPDSLHSNIDIDIEKHRRMDDIGTDVQAVVEKEGEEALLDWIPGRQEWFVMITLATISLMVALDATILVPVLPTLAVDLHGTANEALWTGTSYLLTSAVFQPFIAALSDIFGRRELLFPSLLLFTAGTGICCAAHNFAVMLAGRCVQGIGGGGIITLSQVGKLHLSQSSDANEQHRSSSPISFPSANDPNTSPSSSPHGPSEVYLVHSLVASSSRKPHGAPASTSTSPSVPSACPWWSS